MKHGDLVQFSGPLWHMKEFKGKYGVFEDWYCPTRGYANIFFFFCAGTHAIRVENLTVVSRL